MGEKHENLIEKNWGSCVQLYLIAVRFYLDNQRSQNQSLLMIRFEFFG